MKKLLNPRWIFFTNTLFLCLLLLLSYLKFISLKGFLDAESIALWSKFGAGLLLFILGNAAYAIAKIVRKESVDLFYLLAGMVLTIAYLYIYFVYHHSLLSWRIPEADSEDLNTYIGGFFMPSLFYYLSCMVVILTKKPEEKKIGIQLLCAILIPASFYGFGTLLVPLWSGLYFSGGHVFVCIGILGVCAFLFFMFRLFYVFQEKKKLHSRYGLWIKIPFGIILPLAGLALNMALEVFGDYSNYWFFIIAVINGIVVSLPSPIQMSDRFVMFVVRCITFAFTFYFFIVFLPLTPISAMLVVFFGLGILLLTPLILFIIHWITLVEDYRYLKTRFRSPVLIASGIAGFLVLPFIVTLSMYHDKKILHSTLEYVYSPDYGKEYKLSPASIQRTFEIAGAGKKREAIFSSTPYISTWFRFIVFDNMTLSWEKRKLLSQIFAGEDHFYPYYSPFESNRATKEKNIEIIQEHHTSRYDHQKGVWISKIDLHIENFEESRWNTEYITYFDLPDGCWISDYYLFVGDVEEPGILAERKAVTWIFNQIRNKHRDPGLLRYVGGNTIEFKVFPFEQGEVRRTGIEFIHIDPVQIQIDDYTIQLGESAGQVYDYAPAFLSQDQSLVYLSAHEKALLQPGTPEPYFHFIVDISGNKNVSPSGMEKVEQCWQTYEESIQNVLTHSPFNATKYKITYTNSTCYTEESGINEEVTLNRKKLPKQMNEPKEGFFLQRAIETILVENYQQTDNSFPVLIVISADPEKSILTNNFDDLRFTYPYLDKFYFVSGMNYLSAPLFGEWDQELNTNLRNCFYPEDTRHTSYSTVTQGQDSVWYIPGNLANFRLPEVKVKSYGNYFVPDNGLPSFVLNSNLSAIPDFPTGEIAEKSRTSAWLMQERRMLQTLNPRLAETEWLNMLRASFASRLLTPATAYIVVETEAQRRVLAEKQKQVMSGHRDMDLGTEWVPMSEPDILILLALLGFVLWVFRKNKKQIFSQT